MKILITLMAALLGFFHSLFGSFFQQASVPINNALNTIVATADKELTSQTSDGLSGAPSQVAHKISSQRPIMRIRIIRPNVRRLPRNIGTQAKASSGNVVVMAGDSGVSQFLVSGANQIISSISLPILQANVGRTPSQSVDIVLFSSANSYALALERAGVDPSLIGSIVNNTGGITVNSDIWIPLYALQDKADLADVLTHELTHVVFNQMGIGQQLPTWLNEGTAWYDGLAAQASVDPSGTQAQITALRQSVLQAVQSGRSLPLTASEAQILNASYNVEFEDYMATQNLISKYGTTAFKSFISRSVSQGVSGSFAAQFGISMDSYAQSYYQSLQQTPRAYVRVSRQQVQSLETNPTSDKIIVVPNSSVQHSGRFGLRSWKRLIIVRE